MDKCLSVVLPHQSVTTLGTSCFEAGYKQHANTVNKQRWIGSTQLPKVGLVDQNPKDHVFVPQHWFDQLSSEDVWFAPTEHGDVMSLRAPSDHLGVGCILRPSKAPKAEPAAVQYG